MFPLRNYDAKVVSHISNKYDGFFHDKPLYVDLDGGCCVSKRRIDLRKLINSTILCIEVDEKQHRRYCKIDEEIRYNDLFMDFSGKYIFIRFNPDKYKDKKGNTRNPMLARRIDRLIDEINFQIERIKKGENKSLLEIIHMYYDES